MQIGIRVDLAVVIFHQCISAQGAKLGSALVNRLGVGVVELQIIRSGLRTILQLDHGMAVLNLKNAFHLALRHRLCQLQILWNRCLLRSLFRLGGHICILRFGFLVQFFNLSFLNAVVGILELIIPFCLWVYKQFIHICSRRTAAQHFVSHTAGSGLCPVSAIIPQLGVQGLCGLVPFNLPFAVEIAAHKAAGGLVHILNAAVLQPLAHSVLQNGLLSLLSRSIIAGLHFHSQLAQLPLGHGLAVFLCISQLGGNTIQFGILIRCQPGVNQLFCISVTAHILAIAILLQMPFSRHDCFVCAAHRHTGQATG